jgi:uncharacterized membrane protein
MRALTAQLAQLLGRGKSARNLGILARFLLGLCIVVVVYSILFHFIMQYEGREPCGRRT